MEGGRVVIFLEVLDPDLRGNIASPSTHIHCTGIHTLFYVGYASTRALNTRHM